MSSLFGSSKNFSLIPFKGERSKWHMWKLKYRARIRIYGVLDILDGVSSIPPDGKSSYNDDDLLLRSKNEELYADLILNIQDEASFGCVSRARTKDFKEGLASLAWKNLVEKYEGLEKSNKMDLKRELLSSHLNKNDDPDGWITKLEKLIVNYIITSINL